MKKIISIVAILLSIAFLSCGSDSSGSNDPGATNSSDKFGITGVALTIGAESSSAKVSRAPLPAGAYVTWETWIENSQWPGIDGAQGGSYTDWSIQTPAIDGDNITEIVGLAKTCICTDIDNKSGNLNVYYCYYGIDYFYLATKGTLHLPDGRTFASEYRQAILITPEISHYIDYEVMGQNENTFNDRLTITLSFVVAPDLF